MPITEELKNLKKFESVGFSHEQSETLADVIEKAQASGQESLKEFISNENKDLRNELGKQTNDFDLKLGSLDNRLSKQISALEVNMAASQKDLNKQISALEVNMAASHKDLNKQISALEVNMAASQKDLLIKIFGIIVGTVGVAVTILKLFP